MKKGSVWLVVPMATALPTVATTAAKRRMRSSTPSPRLAALPPPLAASTAAAAALAEAVSPCSDDTGDLPPPSIAS